VIRRLNDRFGTDFIPYVKTDQAERQVIAAIDRSAHGNYAAADFESRVGRPSLHRVGADSPLSRLDDREWQALTEAQEVYERVLTRAAQPGQT
jgi:hypothetical protein